MTIQANCKINIGLDVVARREDGYHELSTVMVPVSGLFDTLHIDTTQNDGVDFIGKGLIIDCPKENNLCVKAYLLMKKHFPNIGGIRIVLHKNVPFGAGLGGGSSDATAVIVAINTLFNLNLEGEQLLDLAAQIGSDTAFFVRNTPQLCSGRGEIMHPVDINLRGKYLLIVKPDVHISTKEAYAGVTPARPTTPLSQLIELPIDKWQGVIKNDFEPHIFRAHPLLIEIKSELLSQGAKYAAMSGSGSTIFGIFDSEVEAKKATSKFMKLNDHLVFLYQI